MDGKPTYEELKHLINELQGELTRRKLEDRQRFRNGEQYRLIVESASVAVLVAQKGRIVFANPMASVMTGYSREELLARPFVDFIHPEDSQMVLDRHLRRTRGEDLPSSYQFRILRKDGAALWVEIITMVLDWEGEPATLNFLNDVSSRRQAEEALERRDRLLESVTGMTRLLIAECDLDRAMRYALKELGEAVKADRAYVFINHRDPSDGRLLMSQRWEWTNGAVSSEMGNPVLQNLPYDALTPELLDDFRQKKAFAKHVEDLDPYSRGILEAQGILSVLQVPIYVQDELWGLIGFDDCTAKRTWLDLETGILMIAADCLGALVTRLRTEEELRVSEEKFRSVSKMLRLMCDNVPDMIWAKDLQRRYIFANRAICRDLLNAKDTDEPIGKTDMFFATRERESHPENPKWHTFGEICTDSDLIVMESGRPGRFDEYGNVKGKFLALEVLKAPFLDEEGRMVGTVGCARDVTASREMEARYRLLTEKMRDICWIIDLNLRTAYVSPSIRTVLGFTPEERMAQPLSEQMTPESLAKAMEVFRNEMELERLGKADPERSVTLVLEYYHKDGSTRWLENLVTGLRNEQGVLTGIHGVSRDITERRRKEADEAAKTARCQREAGIVSAIASDPNLVEGNLKALAERITEAASEAVGVERVGVWLFDENETRLSSLDIYTSSSKGHSSGEVLLEHEFRNEFEALRGSKYLAVRDAMNDPRTAGYVDGYLKPNNITSMLDAVIRLGGRNLGVICLEHVGNIRDWQDDEIAFACQLADQLAIAFSNRQRRQAEAALRESEQRYRYLVENTSEAILVIQDGMVKFVNNRTVVSFGYSEEELLSLPIFDLVHPDDRDMVMWRYLQKINGDPSPTRHAYRVIHKSGAVRWIEISSVLIEWHGRPATLNLIIDITDRKEAEQALRESEERFRVLTEKSPLGMALIGEGGRYEYLNPAFTGMFGYTLEDIPTGRDWFRRAYPDPVYRKQVKAAWREEFSAQGQGGGRQQSFIVTCKDGSQKRVLFWPLVNISGKQLLICEDITERIRAEEEREKLRGQLLQAQKMEALGSLAGGIAHDFNNILAAVIGYVELAQLDVAKDSRTAHYLAQVMKAGERARDLVKRILAFARRVEPGVKPTRLGQVVKEVTNLLMASLPSTIEIRSEMRTERDTIMADPAQIHQVLMNLATNAGHAMREGGGILEMILDEEEVTSRQMYPEIRQGRYVRLKVRDTGCGMSREIMERIFDPYFTTKQAGVGTGLGLAVVNGIVREHKGAVRVDSLPGRGTTFTVLFPALEEEIADDMAEQDELLRGEGSILLVDDEEMLVEMWKGMLERLGYKVCGMTGSLEALEAFKADPTRFDLVITDMTMPHMTGDILARELLRIRPDLPIIACTGFSEMISEEKAARIGIRALVMKPLTVRDIAGKVKDLLGGAGALQASVQNDERQ